MERAYLGLALLAVALSGDPARAQQHPDPEAGSTSLFEDATVLTRSALLEAVLERNPSIAAAQHRWNAALEQIPQASSLDDPMASYSLAPLSIGSSDATFGQVLRLGQKLPFPGTLRQQREAAEASAGAARHRVDEVRQQLALMASSLYDDYWLVGRALSITDEHIDLLDSFKRVAVGRYAAGTAPQQAPIQAEVEAAHLLHRQVALRAERRKLIAKFNALLHRPADAVLPPASRSFDIDLAGSPSVEAGNAARPEIAARQDDLDALRARVGLEKLRFKPDFEAMASYNSMWGDGDHRWMVGVGIRVPLWRQRLRASVAEAEARLAAAEGELVALTDTIAAEVEVAQAAIEEAEHVVRLYRNRVLPAARDQVAAARASFETGEGSMLGLIDAERSLLSAELSHEEALAGVARSRAELDRALGRMPFGLSAPEGDLQ